MARAPHPRLNLSRERNDRGVAKSGNLATPGSPGAAAEEEEEAAAAAGLLRGRSPWKPGPGPRAWGKGRRARRPLGPREQRGAGTSRGEPAPGGRSLPPYAPQACSPRGGRCRPPGPPRIAVEASLRAARPPGTPRRPPRKPHPPRAPKRTHPAGSEP